MSTGVQVRQSPLAYLPHRARMLASVSCAGQHRCGLPAPDIVDSYGAIVHAHAKDVGVALREVKAGDACTHHSSRQQHSQGGYGMRDMVSAPVVSASRKQHCRAENPSSSAAHVACSRCARMALRAVALLHVALHALGHDLLAWRLLPQHHNPALTGAAFAKRTCFGCEAPDRVELVLQAPQRNTSARQVCFC